ncbi:MAG: hypothetical protein A2481_00600 [Candidatus Yonathbacteria bacterium RIFOXYC2_FULL_47_9]|nr:MAG: hypothetical protein A2481_00600 [Candidatus Yonathbacteria bacterium RIFOXYC2_FULL_47_9]
MQLFYYLLIVLTQSHFPIELFKYEEYTFRQLYHNDSCSQYSHNQEIVMGAEMNGSQDQEQELEQYIRGQFNEMQSDLNKWGAGEEFGHDPSCEELAIHYIKSGGARRYAERHNRNTGAADL